MKSLMVISVENHTVLPDNEDERDKRNFFPNISTSIPSGFSAITFSAISARNLRLVPAYQICEVALGHSMYFGLDKSLRMSLVPLIKELI